MLTYSIVLRGDEDSLHLNQKIRHFLDCYHYKYDEKNPKTVFVIGGDGTFLKAVHQYMHQLNEVVFIGIHTGTLGFMCDYQVEEVDDLLNMFINEKPRIFKYPVLEVTLSNSLIPFYAFNEVRIQSITNTLSMNISINNEFFENFKGCGVCLCTQIGSTAINRSLGGAIIQHGLPLIELSEINGIHHWKHHSLKSSFILSADSIIDIEPINFKNSYLCYDHMSLQIDDCSSISIKNSKYSVHIARYKSYSYLSRLKNVF